MFNSGKGNDTNEKSIRGIADKFDCCNKNLTQIYNLYSRL